MRLAVWDSGGAWGNGGGGRALYTCPEVKAVVADAIKKLRAKQPSVVGVFV